MKYIDPLLSKVLPLSPFRKISKKPIILFGVVLLIAVLVPGSVLAYSQRLKNWGDNEYKNQNYTTAREIYRKAKEYWFPERISSKLQDRDLESKMIKADIMIQSGQSYLDGLKEFGFGNYETAAIYLLKVAENDLRYSEAREMISFVEENKKGQAIATPPRKVLSTPTPSPTSTITKSITPTPTQNITIGVDNDKPNFERLEVSSNKVGRGQTILIYVYANDSESGLDRGDTRASDDTGNLDVRADGSCTKISITKLECPLKVPPYGKIGTWHIDYLNIRDIAGHELFVDFGNNDYTFQVE